MNEETVVLRRPDGTAFALSRVDDFELEVELLRRDPEFLAFLRSLSQEEGVVSLQDLRRELTPGGARKPPAAKTRSSA